MCFLKGEGFSSKGVFPQGDFLAIFFVCLPHTLIRFIVVFSASISFLFSIVKYGTLWLSFSSFA